VAASSLNKDPFPSDTAFSARVRHAEPVMGTVVSFDVPVAARHDGSLDDAIRWLHWVDRVFSPFRRESDVSLLAGGEVTVDGCAPEMAEVIEACAFVRDVMAPEQARNVITPVELDAMAGNRKARKAYRKASRNRGECRRARYILNAAYALADELAAARGADTDRVRFARSEVARIRAGIPSPW